MRITPITTNVNYKKNISFKRFLDDNARKTVKEMLSKKLKMDDEWCAVESLRAYKKMENRQYLDVFTDASGEVKTKFDLKHLSKYPIGDDISLDSMYSVDKVQALKTTGDVETIEINIDIIDKIIAGATMREAIGIEIVESSADTEDIPYEQTALGRAEYLAYW